MRAYGSLIVAEDIGSFAGGLEHGFCPLYSPYPIPRLAYGDPWRLLHASHTTARLWRPVAVTPLIPYHGSLMATRGGYSAHPIPRLAYGDPWRLLRSSHTTARLWRPVEVTPLIPYHGSLMATRGGYSAHPIPRLAQVTCGGYSAHFILRLAHGDPWG
jgi:hypothetical protein